VAEVVEERTELVIEFPINYRLAPVEVPLGVPLGSRFVGAEIPALIVTVDDGSAVLTRAICAPEAAEKS